MNKIFPIIVSAIIVLFVLWAIIGRQADQKDLHENGQIVNAKVISWLTPSKGSTIASLYCQFTYNNKVYTKSSPTSFSGGLQNLVGQTFPGVFAINTGVFEILITPQDFKKFNMTLPDSLKKWNNFPR